MERRTNSIIKEIDKLIESIIPHTGDFRKEVSLFVKREKLHKKLDIIIEKYDKLIASLEKGSEQK